MQRDQFFRRYGGVSPDPYESIKELSIKGVDENEKIMKTGVLNETPRDLVTVEELWQAPLEFQDI